MHIALFLPWMVSGCALRCVHGSCHDYCVCDPGWAGEDCSFYLMGSDDSLDMCPENCSGHGTCVNGSCECDRGWTHSTCSVSLTCQDNCNPPAGRCVAGACVCEAGFTGTTCATQLCPNNCWGHGECHDGRCRCHPQWSGDTCNVALAAVCDPPCMNDGRCIRSGCLCPQGWTGIDCSRPVAIRHVAPPKDAQALERVKTRLQIEQQGLDSLQAAVQQQKAAQTLRESLENKVKAEMAALRELQGDLSPAQRPVAGGTPRNAEPEGNRIPPRAAPGSGSIQSRDVGAGGAPKLVVESNPTPLVNARNPQSTNTVNMSAPRVLVVGNASSTPVGSLGVPPPSNPVSGGLTANSAAGGNPLPVNAVTVGVPTPANTAAIMPLAVSSPVGNAPPAKPTLVVDKQLSANPAAGGTLSAIPVNPLAANPTLMVGSTLPVAIRAAVNPLPSSNGRANSAPSVSSGTVSPAAAVNAPSTVSVGTPVSTVVVSAPSPASAGTMPPTDAVGRSAASVPANVASTAAVDAPSNTQERHPPPTKSDISGTQRAPNNASLEAAGPLISASATAAHASVEPAAHHFITDLGPLPALVEVPAPSDARGTAPVVKNHPKPEVAASTKATAERVQAVVAMADKLEDLAHKQMEEGAHLSHPVSPSGNTALRGSSGKDEEKPTGVNDVHKHIPGAVQLNNAAVVPSPSQCACLHGVCIAGGKCTCDEEYTGETCDTKRCPMDCNQVGLCINERCACDSKHFGDACQHLRCPDDCSGQGACVDGACECKVGYKGENCGTAAGSQTVVTVHSPESADEVNIGRAMRVVQQQQSTACPEACNEQGSCDNGVCRCYTGYTGLACQDYCPNECSRQGECIKGACLCFAGFLGVDCSIKGCCSGHGACDTPGLCVCDPGWSGEDCSIALTCPAPTCSEHGTCVNGMCNCNPGFKGPTCADSVGPCVPPCKPECTCNEALKTCECKGGFTGLPGRAAGNAAAKGAGPSGAVGPGQQATTPPAASCGNCSGHGKCDKKTGTCKCNKGWFHHDCSKQHCPAFDGTSECSGHGLCINAVCHCTIGWGLLASSKGPNVCGDRVCAADCGPHGACVNGACVCEQGFSGDTCRDLVCPKDCSGHGICRMVSLHSPPECQCEAGWSGAGCAVVAVSSVLRTCVHNCNGNGLCFDGKCVCNAGFTGSDCSDRMCDEATTGPRCTLTRCPHDCDGKGLCFNGHCMCWGGFIGVDCSVPLQCYGACRDACVETRSEQCMFCVGQCLTAESPVLAHHSPFDDLVGT